LFVNQVLLQLNSLDLTRYFVYFLFSFSNLLLLKTFVALNGLLCVVYR